MNKENIKIGDEIIILEKPEKGWSSYFSKKDGRNKVKYPYRTKIQNIKIVNNEKEWRNHTAFKAGGWGWCLEDCNYIINPIVETYETF